MDNTELFLDKYKELENAAINEFKLPPDGSAVAKLEKRSEFKDIRFELNYCREVRNLLQHNRIIQRSPYQIIKWYCDIHTPYRILDAIQNHIQSNGSWMEIGGYSYFNYNIQE